MVGRFVLVMMVLWATAGLAVQSGAAQSEESDQLSGPGGIGNTRDDIFEFWSIDARDHPGEPMDDDGFSVVLVDLPDYQIFFVFEVEDDRRDRATDRLVSMSVSYIDFAPRGAADRMIDGFLPDDAEKEGRPYLNRYDETVQEYRSDSVEESFPSLDIEGFEEAGTVYVTYYLVGGDVGVFDISLYNDRM